TRPTATVATRYPTTIAQSTGVKFIRRAPRGRRAVPPSSPDDYADRVRQLIPGAGEGAVATGRGRGNVLGEMRANLTSPGSYWRRTLAALVVLVTGVAAVNVSGSGADPQPSLPTLPLPALPALPGAAPPPP